MKYIFVLLVALILVSCGGPKFVLDTRQVTFTQLLDHISENQQKLRTIDASSRITVDSEEFSGTFFADILYNTNDSLLISATGPFGIHAGTLFIGRQRFIFNNRIANKFYNGSVDQFRHQQFFQFPLNLSEFMNIFAAREDLSVLRVLTYDTRDDDFFLQTQRGDMIQDILIDPQIGQIIRVEAKKGDKTLYIREYGDFMHINNIMFPRRITMTRPDEKQAIAIYYTNIRLNESIDRDKFMIKISDRAEQIDGTLYSEQ
jgi:outer membrane lipoprotein-sorting protein